MFCILQFTELGYRNVFNVVKCNYLMLYLLRFFTDSFFINREFLCILEKDCEMVSLCLQRGYVFGVFFLLDNLPPKVKEDSLPCDLTPSRRKKRQIHNLPKGISAKVKQQTSPEFELGNFCVYIDIHYTTYTLVSAFKVQN